MRSKVNEPISCFDSFLFVSEHVNVDETLLFSSFSSTGVRGHAGWVLVVVKDGTRPFAKMNFSSNQISEVNFLVET